MRIEQDRVYVNALQTALNRETDASALRPKQAGNGSAMCTQGGSRVSPLYEGDRPTSERRHMEHGEASWRRGVTATRDAIVDPSNASRGGGPESIPEAERIACLRQRRNAVDREAPADTAPLHRAPVGGGGADDSALAETQPYKAARPVTSPWLGAAVDKHYAGDDTDLKLLTDAILVFTAGMSVEEYEASVGEF